MSVVAPAIDLREEMDASAMLTDRAKQSSVHDPHAAHGLQPDARDGAECAQLLSPSANKKHQALVSETDIHLPDNPFDNITEEKLISVDSGKQSVEVIGELLPSLQQLKLQNSTLHSFRDLGTSLHSLQILWVMRSGINDLDGIGVLTGLQELYLQYNGISDLSPLTLHDEIQVIAFCAQLTALNLEANPVCKIAHYRQIVANFLPQLTTLDDKPITEEERAKISDDEIDAAIKAHQDELAAASLAPATVDDKLLIADGIKSLSNHYDDRSPRRLSRSSSTQRVVGFDPAVQDIAGTPASVSKGSQLSNNESTSQIAALERPKTPARMSITDTLDRANELETQKHKSRDAILNELKAWQQEGIVSQVGVTHVSFHRENDTSPSKASMRRKTPSHTKTSERRPNTSAGMLRNGASLREAFVETRRDKESGTVDHGKTRSKTPSLHRRSSYTPPSVKISSFWDSEDGEDSDSSSSDSEAKSRSAQNKSRRHSRPSQSTFFNVAESLHAIDKWRDEMGDGDAFVSVGSPRTRTLSSRDSSTPSVSKYASRTISTPPIANQQKDESNNQSKTTGVDHPPRGSMKQLPQAPQLGPANYESDERIVQYMKEKHKCVTETKTREGFRRYFHGIEADRLETILQRVFSDPEKVRRRLQLMSGLYRHELPS
ncbi:hypothetical protein FI667_g13040, partial [Globisporangium splendens]